jgi:lipopolysaccharide/colanic/teichoic acid biosynthesis glycosyltransferase
MKEVLILILEAAMVDMKRRCEQNTCEQSRDTYGKWHDQIKNMVDTFFSLIGLVITIFAAWIGQL